MKNPYANAGKKDSDVQRTTWPAVTESFLADVVKLSTEPKERVNQPILALAQARKALNDARLACDYARRLNPSNQKLQDRLESIAYNLHMDLKRFPLDIIGHSRRWDQESAVNKVVAALKAS